MMPVLNAKNSEQLSDWTLRLNRVGYAVQVDIGRGKPKVTLRKRCLPQKEVAYPTKRRAHA